MTTLTAAPIIQSAAPAPCMEPSAGGLDTTPARNRPQKAGQAANLSRVGSLAGSKRAHRGQAEHVRYALPAKCSTCGTAWAKHPRCAACGTATGLGHERAMPEPYGACDVCYGCFRQLRARGWRIRKPAIATREVMLTEVADGP